ncbi:MAG: phage major capsid protein, partial [Cyanobacteria bacterium REEB65]|nr:phage major capsid protein [Cyanobacteria bacterium REEB65]
MDPEELKKLLQQQGEAFEAFKKSHEETVAELKKKGSNDPVLLERLSRIEASLDKAAEAKAAIEAKLGAEKKEREELELKMGRMNLSGHSEESAKRAVEIKTFNDTLNANAKARNRGFTPLDEPGYAAYKAAQDHYFREGKENLTADEVKILSVGSDPDGGYFVTPDVTGRIVKKVYETSPVRQNANVQTISTDALEGIEDLGEAGAGYAGEHTQGTDTTTPQVGKWRIPVFWIDTEPKATQQLLDDAAVDIEAWLAAKVADKISRFENSEFVTGAANKIRGFMLGYTQAADSGSGVTWGTVGYMATGTSADFAASNPADKMADLVGLLKNEYLANAKWFTRRSVITKMRKFKDGQGQ